MRMVKSITLISAIILLESIGGCKSDPSSPIEPNQITSVEQLGKAIFMDTNLSTPSGQSCATCHSPEAGFTDSDKSFPVSKGAIKGRFGNRNAPSVAYAAFSPAPYHDPVQRPGMMMGGLDIGGQFWDGRAASLEEQAKGPLLNPLEMNNADKNEVISKIRNASYASAFEKIFGAGSLAADKVDAAFNHVAEAIAAYERSSEVSPFTSKFDLSLQGKVTLTEQESKGFAVFTGKANCVKCHSIAPVSPSDPVQQKYLFTNYAYQNTGIPKNPGNPYYTLPSSLNPDGSN